MQKRATALVAALWFALGVGQSSSTSAAQVQETPTPTGRLELSVIDAASGRFTPARIEVVDSSGGLHVPSDAVIVPGQCGKEPEPEWYASFSATSPPPTTLRIAMQVVNTATKGEHFYALEGRAGLSLAPGRYQVTAFKGIEVTPRAASVVVEKGEVTRLELLLERFVDMPAKGWFSSDDHIHVVRHDAAVNPLLARWMEAEDVHIANLLEMGTFKGPIAARQYAFGPGGLYQQGTTILAPGQENPRTWTIGHGILLGNTSYIDFPERYLIYRAVWEEAARQGALSGYAHWGGPGWPVDLPTGSLDFLEVLQIAVGRYDDLYLAWNLGYRITPTAGTDYQCSVSGPPGRVRFYTRIDPPLTHAKWFAALQAGRTFVTNGPFLEFQVDQTEAGGTIELASAGSVAVDATVRFDPSRDEVEALEIVRNGEVIRTVKVPSSPGTFHFEESIPIAAPSWLAARTRGKKVGELDSKGERQASVAHTGSIVVEIADQPEGTQPLRRKAAARALEIIAKLDETLRILHGRFQVPQLLTQFDAATLKRDWPELEKDIAASRRHFQKVGGFPVDQPTAPVASATAAPGPSISPAARP